MLTEQEKAWLERRKSPCLHCSNHGKACGYTLHPEAMKKVVISKMEITTEEER